MSRPSLLFIPLFAFALSPFAIACDALKDHKEEAGAPVVTTPPVATPAATTAAPTGDPNAAPPTTGAAPLGATPTTPTAPVPTTHTDAGVKPHDGGAAPTATPTFQIPTAIPGFDAGAFKPPPGFPTAIPTFPPPAKQ